MIDKQKVKAIIEKWQRDRKRSSLSIKDEKYYDSVIYIDLDQENN